MLTFEDMIHVETDILVCRIWRKYDIIIDEIYELRAALRKFLS